MVLRSAADMAGVVKENWMPGEADMPQIMQRDVDAWAKRWDYSRLRPPMAVEER